MLHGSIADCNDTTDNQTDETSDAKKAVYVQVPKDWEAPCVWAWDDDGNNAFEAWPGEEMDADTTNEGWYYIWVPAWANHVIEMQMRAMSRRQNRFWKERRIAGLQ